LARPGRVGEKETVLSILLNRRCKVTGRVVRELIRVSLIVLWLCPNGSSDIEGDRATHHSDHDEDAIDIPEVHVHGIPLNKDQQRAPVPRSTPWPTIPRALEGRELDDWMKARFLVTKDSRITVVVLEPAKNRELTLSGLAALNRWTFDPQMRGDEPVDGELTVRIHFRTQ
jgi:hypothetical protein